eukprot:m.49197 g.49197  ORF g.49197 m.49197 type:complete len:906 (+) comp10603_c0_seq1:100-2817(+)
MATMASYAIAVALLVGGVQADNTLGACRNVVVVSESVGGVPLDGNIADDLRLLLDNVTVVGMNTNFTTASDTLVVVMASVDDSWGSTLNNSQSPMLVFNRGVWQAVGLSSALGGYTRGTLSFTFKSPTFPFAFNKTGDVDVVTSETSLYYGIDLNRDVEVLAILDNHPSVFTLAPAKGGRKAGFGVMDYSVTTDIARQYVLALCEWLCNALPSPPPNIPHPAPQPEQLHVAFGENSTSLVIQWAAPMAEKLMANFTPSLSYWPVDNKEHVITMTPQYSSFGPGEYAQYRATLAGLTLNTSYEYSVFWSGNSAQKANSTFFVIDREDTRREARLVMFGDLGWTDDQVLPYLRDECEAGLVDAIVIFGDMVYWDNGENENSFMRDISTLSANGSVPIMVSPGNGDYGSNYSRYKAQWAMPGWESVASLWHSFDIGSAHVVGINTEALEWGVPDPALKERMLTWLDQDLTAANSNENRAKRPWIIVHFHRPAYSTGNTDSIPYEIFEPLMYKYGVDVVFQGHVHNQERTLPVFNKTTMTGPDPSHPYHNAKAPSYIVSGNPGNAEESNYFNRGFDNWTAFRSYHFGYSHLTVHDSMSITVDFLSTNLGGAITDSVTITKDVACNFGVLCNKTLKKEGGKSVKLDSKRLAEFSKLAKKWRSVSCTDVPAEQISALEELYNTTQGPSWVYNMNWMNNKSPCDSDTPWYGVTCVSVTERTLPSLDNNTSCGITAVHLASNNLVGEIPGSLGAALAPTLQLLDLSGNTLNGTIPMNLLSNLPKLHTLYIEPRENQSELRGSLPDDMGITVPNLRYLGLSRNQLTGTIPSSFGELPCHVTHASGVGHNDPSVGGEVGCLIWLVGNNLTGTVPHSMCNRTYNEVYVGSNNLSCPVPCLRLAYGQLPSCGKCTPC